MRNESPNPNMTELWQCQPVEGIKMSVEEIRKRATRFEKKIMWRNAREYVAGGIAAALLTSFFIQSHDTLFRVACGLMIAGLAYMAYQLHCRASARRMPAELGAANSLQFHRNELERQMDFLRHIWSWYLGPIIPGLVAFSVQSWVNGHTRFLVAAFVNAFFVFCLILVWRLNVYETRCLQKRIDELAKAAAE